jgi:dipeptidyl aminopeptidase/acylaminoacyl peptidase
MTFVLKPLSRRAIGAMVLLALPVALQAVIKQPLTPEACTQIRYLASDEVTTRSPMELSPDGRNVAFVVQVPRIASNDNNEELFVSAADGKSSSIQIPVLQNHLIAAPHWFPDNKSLAVLTRRRGKIILDRVDSISRTEETLWEGDGDITDYSMDATGETIVVAVRDKDHVPLSYEPGRDDRKGYRLDSESMPKDSSDAPRRTVYILRLAADRRWTVAQRVEFTSPLSGKPIKDIYDFPFQHISLSPNGRYLLIDDFENFSNLSLPAAWVRSPIVQYMSKNGFKGPVISYLYDIHTGRATIPLDSPYVMDGRWAPDSKSYIKVAAAPAGSKWEASDFPAGTKATNHMWHMFHVDVATGEVREVLERAENPPTAWKKNGEIVVRDSAGALVTLKEEEGQWRHLASKQIPFPDAAPYSQVTSDGERAVMEYENAGTAPELVAFDLSSSHSWILAKFNPQVDNLSLPQARRMTWTTSTGYTAEGMLLLPPNYDPSHRYPLVIENGSILYDGSFVCDSGTSHVSSFARGILADAGIAYLMRFWPGNNTTWKNNYYPKGYPGNLAEAAFQQDLVESAVAMLTQRQIIDPAKVGLIGFSRGGWYVEYALTHSQIPFRAATVTDNVQFSFVEYYSWHNSAVSSALETMYGGPPFGKSLKNWLDYSISFNLDKINTPLLMEVNGYGKKDDLPNRPPENLAAKEELVVGLSELRKPVELYYYPNEQHQVDHPMARIASLQRNVDWFRFWLQDYRRPAPEDPEQYVRWELMRSEQLKKPDHGDSAARGGDEVQK